MQVTSGSFGRSAFAAWRPTRSSGQSVRWSRGPAESVFIPGFGEDIADLLFSQIAPRPDGVRHKFSGGEELPRIGRETTPFQRHRSLGIPEIPNLITRRLGNQCHNMVFAEIALC